MTAIELTRGEILHMRIRFQEDGSNINVTSPEYSIESWGGSVRGGDEIFDLGANISNGIGVIDYNTENLTAPDVYWFDVKLTLDNGENVWSDSYQLKLKEPNTKP